MTGTNIIQVMGTNIITNWPHASVVTNLNADMVDGSHASEFLFYNVWTNADSTTNYMARTGGTMSGPLNMQGNVITNAVITNAAYYGDGRGLTNLLGETDPQVDDAMTDNYVPKWSTAATALITGTIFDNGNIGIGTVTPDGKIDLQAGSGGTAISISANYPDSYRWRMIPTDRGNAIDLDFTVSDSSDEQERLLQLSRSTSGRPEFALLNNQLVVNNGNVGIGITPHYLAKLDVNGNAAIRGVLAVGFEPPTPLEGWPVDRKLAVNGHTYLFGDVYVKWIWVHSDDRLKFNEQKLEYGLAQVMALEPKRYDRAEWEYDPETEEIVIHPEKISRTNEIGLIAQDVRKVIPEAVSIPENENSQVWSLSYDTIIPVLVKAIQEQQAQIEELKQEIQAIKTGI